LAGRKNKKKAAEENLLDRADRIYSYGSAEGKCYIQALTWEASRVDEMMEEMREYNEKTKHIEKLANKSKQDTETSCALFKVTVHPTRLHVVLWHCCPDCTQQWIPALWQRAQRAVNRRDAKAAKMLKKSRRSSSTW
jgi:hypothetical protein